MIVTKMVIMMLKFLNNKIAIISDPHFGVQINNPIWQKIPIDYAKWLKNMLLKEKIKDIVICGDIFNNREEISILTLHVANEFFKILKDFNIMLIVGNHDIFYKNRTDVNSINILNEWENIHVINDVFCLDQFDRKICFCSWLSDIDKIDKSDILFGHFEIQNFKMNKYVINDDGKTYSDLLKKAKLIFSGHFHLNQERIYDEGTIIYVGNTYSQNWSDCGIQKGFYILDISTLNYKFINNDVSPIFKKYYLTELFENGINEKTKQEFNNNFIKVIIDKKDINQEKIDLLYNKLCLFKPLSLDLEYKNEFEIKSLSDKIEYEQETFDFVKTLKTFVSNLEVENKDDIIKYITELYNKKISEKN